MHDEDMLLLTAARFAITACGLVVALRSINVLRHMNFHKRKEHYLLWLLFGVSYALLAIASAGAIVAAWAGPFSFGIFTWVVANAGLIIFDRRERRTPGYSPEPVTVINTNAPRRQQEESAHGT